MLWQDPQGGQSAFLLQGILDLTLQCLSATVACIDSGPPMGCSSGQLSVIAASPIFIVFEVSSAHSTGRRVAVMWWSQVPLSNPNGVQRLVTLLLLVSFAIGAGQYDALMC